MTLTPEKPLPLDYFDPLMTFTIG